jgi:hypothetical protein
MSELSDILSLVQLIYDIVQNIKERIDDETSHTFTIDETYITNAPKNQGNTDKDREPRDKENEDKYQPRPFWNKPHPEEPDQYWNVPHPEEPRLYWNTPPKGEEDDSTSFIENKIKTLDDGFSNLMLKAENLLDRLSLVGEAKADELTDAEKGKGRSEEGKATDTAALLEEMKLQRESLSSQNTETRNALGEMRDRVVSTREAVTKLDERVSTLCAAWNKMSLSSKKEPEVNEFFAYRLDSKGRRI